MRAAAFISIKLKGASFIDVLIDFSHSTCSLKDGDLVFQCLGLVSIVWWIWSANGGWWKIPLLCALRRAHGNRSVERCLPGNLGWNFGDLVLTSFQNPLWYSLQNLEGQQIINLPAEKNRLFKNHSFCVWQYYDSKHKQREPRFSQGGQTNKSVETVTPHKTRIIKIKITHQSFGYLILINLIDVPLSGSHTNSVLGEKAMFPALSCFFLPQKRKRLLMWWHVVFLPPQCNTSNHNLCPHIRRFRRDSCPRRMWNEIC